MDHPFRSAAVGGFNKQDVLAFLEEQSKQAAQAQQQLQERLDEADRKIETLRQEGEELRRRLEEAQRELETARQGRDSLNAQLEQSGQELAASRGETDRVRREMEKALRDWPGAYSALLRRSARYNRDVEAVQELEKEGKALLIAPADIGGMSTLTKDREAMERLYQMGYDQGARVLEFAAKRPT